MYSTTISRTLLSRIAPDLLVTIYDAAYCAGGQLACDPPADPLIADLLTTIAARHRDEVLAARGWCDRPVTSDEIPGWLLKQQQQADSPQTRAAIERETALGDSAPPDGWMARTAKDGRP